MFKTMYWMTDSNHLEMEKGQVLFLQEMKK